MSPNVRRRHVPESQSTRPSTKHSDSSAQVHEPNGQPVVQIVQKPKTRKRRNTFIFLLGGLCGLVAAGFFASSNDLIEFPELLGDLSMATFVDILPAGLISDVKDLMQGERDIAEAYDSFYVGLKARAEGLHADHPMVMIPGVISTGLESWGTANVSRSYFRKRLWGSWTMMRALVMDKENWKRHVMLDKDTGLDPPLIKLRAAQGFDATDFFITGYWIWNKIFENLATIGYDPTNSYTAAYDWRLSYPDLEVRDRYFSRLKSHIEGALATDGRKVVLASHSMGSQVMFYFFNWVESEHGGHGGSDWVEKHVDSWINISGCMLGAVKDLTAVLSGEMRDTAQLNAFAIYGLEKFLSKAERAEIFRAMPGISSMLPIGGEAVWGGRDWAPDDLPGQNMSYGSFLNFRVDFNSTSLMTNMTVDESIDYLMRVTENWYAEKISKSYSRGIAHTAAEVEKNQNDPKMWHNPLASRLPNAPSLKIFCFYGVGKPTERGYYYRVPDLSETLLNITIDTDFTGGPVDHGVVMGEGDGTVNLLSTGYMCNRGWHMKRYNPAGSRITVVEMPHEPERFNPRGGPKTADHVDILGRQNLNELILRISAGKGDTISNYIVSDILQYADKVKIYEEGEEPKGGRLFDIIVFLPSSRFAKKLHEASVILDGVGAGVHLDMMAMADVEGGAFSEEEEQQLWTDIDTCVSSPCDDHESIDDALRTWLELTARLRDRLPGSQEDCVMCANMLINSHIFQQNREYVRTQLIHSLLQEDDVASLHAITSLLLLDGHYDESVFPRMIEEQCFPRLVELIAAKQDDEDARLHRFLLQLMYEMSRVERLRPEELVLVDDDFIHSLFRIIEGVSNDVHDPYHYPTIRVLLVLNEQYMLASTEPVEGPDGTQAPLTNRIVKCLSLHGPSYRTCGENIILLLNRETETSLQLLILKLLYLLFTTKATYEYFYTNDLRVLLDVIIRNLMDLPDERISLRHTYLRVLYPLLAHTQLSHPPHYKQDEILKVLKILRGSLNAHFAPADDTTVRLVDRVAKVKWLEASNMDGASEVARKFLGMSLSPTQYASSISVGDVAGVMEKPGVQTPSRNAGNGAPSRDAPSPTQDEVSKTVRAKKPLPTVPKHRHGVPFKDFANKPVTNGEVKKVPPKAPPPRRRGKMKVAEPPPIETITETPPES